MLFAKKEEGIKIPMSFALLFIGKDIDGVVVLLCVAQNIFPFYSVPPT